MVGPVGGLHQRGFQHPLPDLADHPAFLGKLDELVGRDRPAGRMLPSQQRFEAAYFLARRAHDRLVGDPHLVAVERLAKVGLQRLAFGRITVHRGFVEHVLAAPGGLGGVERQVRIAHHAVGAASPRVADRNPDRSADRHAIALDHIRARDLLDQRARERLEQTNIDHPRQHRLEFVAAQPADLAMVAHHAGQPLRDLAEQRIADRMAQRVVDILEPVEVDQEQRAALLAARGVAQCLVERLAHQRAIGQSGE